VLLLFDIDGTLTHGGPAVTSFRLALEQTYGTAGPIGEYDFAGKTDPRILRDLLGAAGLSPEAVAAGLPHFWDRYLAELEARIGTDPVTVLPGVRTLIAELAARDDVFLGLVTGNVAGGARLKLRSAGLWHHFPVGGFGSDHEARNELPRFAFDRACRHWGRAFTGQHSVIIGDTPRDVECGRAVGAVTLAVATGRFSSAELRAAGADRILPGFSDTATALEALGVS
jgi:phosphoglycolate phosphatase-like HAD superfamily hydrolase